MYEVVSIPVGDSHVMQTWWLDNAPIAAVEVNDRNILALTVFEKYRGMGHGKRIATALLSEGKQPANIAKSAKGFWKKLKA